MPEKHSIVGGDRGLEFLLRYAQAVDITGLVGLCSGLMQSFSGRNYPVLAITYGLQTNAEIRVNTCKTGLSRVENAGGGIVG